MSPLVRSPVVSTNSAGIPACRACSRSTRPSVVFPEPCAPTTRQLSARTSGSITTWLDRLLRSVPSSIRAMGLPRCRVAPRIGITSRGLACLALIVVGQQYPMKSGWYGRRLGSHGVGVRLRIGNDPSVRDVDQFEIDRFYTLAHKSGDLAGLEHLVDQRTRTGRCQRGPSGQLSPSGTPRTQHWPKPGDQRGQQGSLATADRLHRVRRRRRSGYPRIRRTCRQLRKGSPGGS